MTVKNLIEKLKKIQDKTKPIGYNITNKIVGVNKFVELDDVIGVLEYEDVVKLQHNVVINNGFDRMEKEMELEEIEVDFNEAIDNIVASKERMLKTDDPQELISCNAWLKSYCEDLILLSETIYNKMDKKFTLK